MTDFTGSTGTTREMTSIYLIHFEAFPCIKILTGRAYICPGGEERTGPCPIAPSDRNILYENRMLGLPRIRQLRSVPSIIIIINNLSSLPGFTMTPVRFTQISRAPFASATPSTLRTWRTKVISVPE